VNFYTQPSGTALHIMNSELLVEPNIAIPPNNQEVTFIASSTDQVNLPINVYLWLLSSHTHKLGTDFNVYHRLPNGQKGEQIFDAYCDFGIPGCTDGFYDYQHPPIMYFWPFEAVYLANGLLYEASYINNTGNWVYWGETSEDEMMIAAIMFTYDTTGLGALNPPTGFETIPVNQVRVYPNPSSAFVAFDLRMIEDFAASSISFFDIYGRKFFETPVHARTQVTVNTSNFPRGLIYYLVNSADASKGQGGTILIR
jgi:hypothetical protein